MAARLTAYVVVGIVAATLIAGLIVGAQRDDIDGPVDIIVHNAKVYTAGANGSMAEAVAIRGRVRDAPPRPWATRKNLRCRARQALPAFPHPPRSHRRARRAVPCGTPPPSP